ncbi:hypothetical protein Pmani_036619 [Petrolisthes manimaculis]|uniref:Uncharacterized protein n=1 Tax=Petrolisthes manimaculis TaxID=1843537 RepID=A0AAE1TMI0_9EUCA|nr:hypothetical protein Pmani_036619 [Petrolisthes manimaculis]
MLIKARGGFQRPSTTIQGIQKVQIEDTRDWKVKNTSPCSVGDFNGFRYRSRLAAVQGPPSEATDVGPALWPYTTRPSLDPKRP